MPKDEQLPETKHTIIIGDARKQMRRIRSNSVHLVVTSPPYWTIKDYGVENQIGKGQDLTQYLNDLWRVFKSAIRVLMPGCRLAINIGDQFISAKSKTKHYQIVPLHSYIVNMLMNKSKGRLVYNGSIIWRKVTTSNTSGGGNIMGSYPYPRNGYFFQNYEYIAIFKKVPKKGDPKLPRPSPEIKEKGKLTREEWRTYFRDLWTIAPERQNKHTAMFPVELPKRLIKMYTFPGETVLDPFLGSGTTMRAADLTGRNSIGIEIGFETEKGSFMDVIKERIGYFEYPEHIRKRKFIFK